VYCSYGVSFSTVFIRTSLIRSAGQYTCYICSKETRHAVLQSLKMLTKTVIRSLCEGPVEDVKLILDFSNQWVSIRVLQLLDIGLKKTSAAPITLAKMCLSPHTGTKGSITACAMYACRKFLYLCCPLCVQVSRRADPLSREPCRLSVRSILGTGSKVKFVKGDVNAWRQNSNSQHWEYESQKLGMILSQFHAPTILKTYFPYVQLNE
jgi:hypothetical protein